MKTESSKATVDAQIREQLEGWARAVCAKDVEGVMSHYAPDVRLFDLAPALQYAGADSCRKNWAEWFPSFHGPIRYELVELEVTSGEATAFSHSLNHIRGTRTDGEQTDVWVRATVGFRKRDGEWMITHEHYSAPFYMEPPYKASLDLKP